MTFWVNMQVKTKLLFTFYFLLFLVFSIYSYAFLDIGLTLTSIKPYLDFQLKMRRFGNLHRPLSMLIFIVVSLLLFTLYSLLIKEVKKLKISLNKLIWAGIIIAVILLFAYPAFSHDIFNYIFNAKMVLVYQANPHKHVAMNFNDPMLDFMRNIHTPAPYFYGWTLMSLLPYLLSFGRIFLSLISFKLYSLIFFILTSVTLIKIFKLLKVESKKLRLTLFMLNPLILIESIAIGHNDLAMMLPALVSFYFIFKFKKTRNFKDLAVSLALLIFSISTKYATAVLIPLFIIWNFRPKIDIGLWGAILLFLLPFIRPLDQLHSWYLIWPLTWVFIAKNIKAVYFFCFLSFFALLRYVPYIWYGNWDNPVVFLRTIIYLLVPGILLIIFFIKRLWNINLNEVFLSQSKANKKQI